MKLIALFLYSLPIKLFSYLSGNKKILIHAHRKTFFKQQICYAAHKNLFFSNTGDIYPCCFNREIVLASAKQKINDWLGSESKKRLQNRLSKNDFSLGCQYCKNALEDHNFSLAGSLAYDQFFSHKTSFPQFMEFETDTLCNLHCIMCPENLHSAKSINAYPSDFVQKITPLLKNLKWTKFYGGEPFMIQTYFELWEKIIDTNPHCIIKVQTNGTLLNDRIKALLWRGKFWITISLDSLNPATYNNIRAGANFNKWKENFDFFLDYSHKNRLPMGIAVCPMSYNAEELPQMVNFCNQHKININFNLLTTPHTLSLKYLSSSELEKLLNIYSGFTFKSTGYILYKNNLQYKSFINQIKKWHAEAKAEEEIPAINYSSVAFIQELIKILPSEAISACETKLTVSLSGYNIRINEIQMKRLQQIPDKELATFIESSFPFEIIEKLKEFAKLEQES